MGSVWGSFPCDIITWVNTLLVSIISLSVGLFFAYLFFRSRLTRAQRRLLDAESRIALDSSAQKRDQERLGEALNALTSLQNATDRSLMRAREQLENFLAQQRTDLRGKVNAHRFAASLDINLRELEYRVGQLEKEQVVTRGLQEHLRAMGRVYERLQISAPVLPQTLSAREVTERRNESQIRLVAEIAGVVERLELIQADCEMQQREVAAHRRYLADQGRQLIERLHSLIGPWKGS